MPSATNLQANRPLYSVLPLVTQISYTDSSATMNYNALQSSLRKRFGSGIEFLASYTWSQSMSDNLGYYGPGVLLSPRAPTGRTLTTATATTARRSSMPLTTSRSPVRGNFLLAAAVNSLLT